MTHRLGFGSYLLAFLLPPLYFLTRGRFGVALINGFFFLLSLPLMPVFGIGFVPWFICVAHALFDVRGALKAIETERIADLVSQRVTAQQAALDADRQHQQSA